jgi:TonB-linked SusC/RagA family outer membrane protein
MVGLMSVWSITPLHAQRVADARRSDPSAEAEVFRRLVTVKFDSVSLARAMELIAASANVRISYQGQALNAAPGRVSLHATRLRLDTALDRVLEGTSLRAQAISADLVTIKTTVPDSQAADGTILGVVTDAKTQKPLADVTVILNVSTAGKNDNAMRSTVTDESGRFRFPHVAVGIHRLTVRRLGYTVSAKPVTVASDRTTTTTIALEANAAVRLTDVVTTGAGDRQRVEVGNSVATINADSIVRTTPIRNLSDLLAARVPGVDVLSTSGQVGAPSTIRIRGRGSISSTTDPIVIVDGMRVNGGHKTGFSDANANLFLESAPTTSPLNDIDPNSIESIDILRGPSASAMYGSDAANGVIVIKTKRGKAGPTRWNVFGTASTSSFSATYAENYFGWGSSLFNDTQGVCPLSVPAWFQSSMATKTCTQDSVSHFSPLNAKDTSPFKHGGARRLGGDVSGGTSRLQYFLGADYQDEDGMLKLAEQDYHALATLRPGQALEDWQVRPNVLNGTHVNARLSAQVNDAADVGISTAYLHQYHRVAGDIGSLIWFAMAQPGYRDTLSYGWGSPGTTPASRFSTLTSDETDRFTGSVNGTWRVRPWLTTHGTGGIDHGVSGSVLLQPRGAFDGTATGAAGQAGNGTSTTRLYNADLGAESAIPLTPRVVWRSSAGWQFNRTQSDVIGINAQGLAYGSNTSQGAASLSSIESHMMTATVGWYVETGIALAERFFATASIRSDRGSAFSGSNDARFPKFNVSWLVSDEPFAQRAIHALRIDNLRLRAAYGQAGVQPDLQTRYRTYSAVTGNVNGTQGLVSILNSLGNPAILPERSVETEFGADLGFWNERLTVEATFYRKITKDALVTPTLPPSFGGFNHTTNLGRVRNRGVELSMSVRPIESDLATWNVIATYGANTNTLEKGNSTGEFALQRYVVGYPLGGYWERPVVGYADVNHNGLVDVGEIQLGDSAVFLGAPYPKADLSLRQTLSLFSGRLALAVGIDLRDHLTQLNQTPMLCGFYCRGAADPSASIFEQIRAQEGLNNSGSFGPHTLAPFVETVSWVRLNDLSLTYALPARFTRVVRGRSASISLMGRNLGLWTKYTGADPEVNSSFGASSVLVDRGGVPQPREWSLRLNLGF